MSRRWKIIDIIIAILAASTIAFYFLSRDTFKLLLWLLVIIVLFRVGVVVRRRFFWKIRNRLIFAGVFLVATPIFFITLFFYLIGNVFINQYGAVIINKSMNEQLNRMEDTGKEYLRMPVPRFAVWEILKFAHPSNFTAAFWEKKDNMYKSFFNYPKSLNVGILKPNEFKGYFKLGNKLYHGVLKKDPNMAILLAFEVTQEYLDGLFSISDFRVQYRPPSPSSIQKSGEINGNPQSTAVITQQAKSPDNDDILLPFFVFEYTYLDFDTPKNSQPIERRGDFLLNSDSNKVYKKINSAIFDSSQGTIKGIILTIIVFFGTFIIVSFLIGFRMIRVITRSIDQLTRGTQKIRNGDFSFRIKTRSGDQMQYLADCFNEMAAGIDRLLVDEKEKQRLEEELRIARSIQLKLLPPESLHTDEFEIAAVNIPATEIAGDYFDYFYKPGNYLSLLVADVSGKGASAAFYMAELKGVINHLQRMVISPAALIAECHCSLKDTFDKVTFITMNIAQFIIPEKKFILARAGHTPALYFNAHEKKFTELQPDGSAIGLPNFSRQKLQEVEINYRQGDILLLFSDGLTEIMNEQDEILGIEKLKQIILQDHLLSTEELKRKILDYSIEFAGTSANRDDLTFILIKVK